MLHLLRIFIALAVVIVATPSVGGDLPPQPETIPNDPQELEIFQNVHLLRINDTHWTHVDIDVALKELTAKSKSVDPKHKGIKFAFHFDSGSSKTGRAGYTVHRDIQNIVFLDATPIVEILGYISSQTNLLYKIDREGVIFSP